MYKDDVVKELSDEMDGGGVELDPNENVVDGNGMSLCKWCTLCGK